ncbi:PPOX class F420-dependent oxidoreductase [Mycolicibacterium sp. XJ870]
MLDSAAENVSKSFFRAMDKMRHRDASQVIGMVPTGQDFTGFDKTRQILLVTFKRPGEAMPSPIYHGVAEGKLYVRTDARTGKIKRLRNNPHVVVAPCSLRGKPNGHTVAGLARILPETDHAHADEAIAANWTWPMKAFERSLYKGSHAIGIQAVYVEITPAP